MAHEVKTITAFDGAVLHYREWMPPNGDGAVICLHGIQSHSGWFLESCECCANHGFRVLSLDRRGSGLNLERRGHTPSYRVLLRDVHQVVRKLRAEGESKIHLMGISWGGKLAACYAAALPDEVDSLLLVAPGLAQKVGLSAIRSIAVSLSSVLSPRTLFHIPIEKPEMFTSNPERIRFIAGDALRLKRCSARMMAESRCMDIFLRRNVCRIRIPAMLMLAEHDPIVDNAGIVRIFKRFRSVSKEVRVFQRAWHTIEFEEDNKHFLEATIQWLRKAGER